MKHRQTDVLSEPVSYMWYIMSSDRETYQRVLLFYPCLEMYVLQIEKWQHCGLDVQKVEKIVSS